MDGLRKRMEADFWEEQKFGLPTPFFSVVDAFKSQASPIQTKTNSVMTKHLLQSFGTQPTAPEAETWRFQLVKIKQSEDESLEIDKVTFEALFKLFRIDETALYMFSRQIVGIHRFISISTTPRGQSITSSFLSSVSGTVFWSHDKSLQQTKAIFIPRPWGNSVEGSEEMFHQLERTIEHQKALIELPCFLQLVSAINLTAWLDTVIETQLEQIRWVESATGYGTWTQHNDPSRPTALVDMSQKMGASASALANALRHADLITDFVSTPELRQTPTKGTQDVPQTSEAKARELADHLRARVAMRKRDVEYLQQRVNSQLTVV